VNIPEHPEDANSARCCECSARFTSLLFASEVERHKWLTGHKLFSYGEAEETHRPSCVRACECQGCQMRACTCQPAGLRKVKGRDGKVREYTHSGIQI
jgi:hypothetical protein